MSSKRTWTHQLVAVALALISLCCLRVASHDIGYVRDEAAYFSASLKINRWLKTAVKDPSGAFRTKDRAFGFNREHPAGLKLLAAALGPWQEPVNNKVPGQRLRWPAHIIAALGVYLIAILGIARYGLAIGAFCAAAFIALPRVFFHAQLHCFDIAIAVAALGVSAAFVRFVREPTLGRTAFLGLCFGLALSIKHNALLFPAFLGSAYAWYVLEQKTARKALPSMLIRGSGALALGALVMICLWPWLWTDPISRWIEYIDFHREHSYYNMAFLGHSYNQPPLPMAYPWVITAVTWPLSWLLLVIAGIGLCVWRRNTEDPLASRVDLVMALGPLILISLPSVPIFGGSKHWITAYPFLCLLMGKSLASLIRAMRLHETRIPKLLTGVGLSLLFCPSLVDNLRSHPKQLAQYAGWMGGPRAAARMGLGRAFWGSMCVPTMLARIDDAGRLFTHDMHPYLLGAYRNDGLAGQVKSGSRRKSTWALHFYEDHFLIDELWTHRAGFTAQPRWVCGLDDVPLTSLYKKDLPER